jgi:UDP-3-O-[3-hydroxymyristoyl] N-acetylglucosamine deacetylase
MKKQTTLARPISLSGISLHTGETVTVTLKPAPVNHGVVFYRTDVQVAVAAHHTLVEPSPLCTTLVSACGRARVATVEHLLSALAGSRVDNVLVEIDGPEMPIMDGSAAPFVQAMASAGVIHQTAQRRAYRVLRPVHVYDGEKTASLLPTTGNDLSITCRIDFRHAAIGAQTFTLSSLDDFSDMIARARTFGFEKDVDTLRKMGLARGGSLENAIVFGDSRVLNPEGMRYENECVRHKVLDAIGDLYLAGLPLIGEFYGYCSGHFLNYRLLTELFADPDAYEDVLWGAEEKHSAPYVSEGLHPLWA